MTKLDFEDLETTHDKAKKGLNKYLSDLKAKEREKEKSTRLKFEETLIAEEHEVLVTYRWNNKFKKTTQKRSSWRI